MVAVRLLGTMDVMTGAVGGETAGTTGSALEAEPSPMEFMARILIEYEVPLVNPVIRTGLLVCAGLNAVQVEPPLLEYL